MNGERPGKRRAPFSGHCPAVTGQYDDGCWPMATNDRGVQTPHGICMPLTPGRDRV